ncbi:MAG: trypsin-like peptidase domain-containing protein [Bacteroidetes bacterium]|nr:trypsin-like peptidase domain-containing protein [Bacteroidota bacterium]
MKIIKYLVFTILGFSAGIAGAFTFYHYGVRVQLTDFQTQTPNYSYRTNGPLAAGSVDFVKASETSRAAVVYIKVVSTQRQQSNFDNPFFDLFGNQGGQQVSSSGSGVIISGDGYIVTNNHVVQDAEKIEVITNNNKKTYTAKVIGTDASSDMALIKISGTNLPYLNFANSDNLQVGEWVLAVGNPFNLTSSVTAGIVSAKGRNINLVHSRFPIESFIQTDAAINPGNSGGALVNAQAELVGINTAILSQTGSYAGYGFAIPANIVKKVITDIKDAGYVKRAFIEATVSDIDDKIATELNEDNISGVSIRAVSPNGNADNAGLKKGDVIIKFDNKFIDTRSLFDEQLAYHRPGDKVVVSVKRGKEIKDYTITLTNQRGTTSLEKTKSLKSQFLGAEFDEITKQEKEKFNIENGIRISNISGNGQVARMGLPEGFIITKYNGNSYANPADLIKAMENGSGRISIEGIGPNGSKSTYSFFSY